MLNDAACVKAEIFTPHHRYSGSVSTRGNRLADFLNDPTTEVVELKDVTISQPSNARSDPFECPQLQLKKDAIILAIPLGSHEAPTKRLFSYVEKKHYLAHVVMPAYCLVGTVHLPANSNHWMFLCEGGTAPSFVPITDVTLRIAASNAEPVQSKVIIFRRQYIESVFISARPESEHSMQDLTAQLRALVPDELRKELEAASSHSTGSALPRGPAGSHGA